MNYPQSRLFHLKHQIPANTTRPWLRSIVQEQGIKFKMLKDRNGRILRRRGCWLTPPNCGCHYIWGNGIIMHPESQWPAIATDVLKATIDALIAHDREQWQYLRADAPNCCNITLYGSSRTQCGRHSDDDTIINHEKGIISVSIGRPTLFVIYAKRLLRAVTCT